MSNIVTYGCVPQLLTKILPVLGGETGFLIALESISRLVTMPGPLNTPVPGLMSGVNPVPGIQGPNGVPLALKPGG